MDSLRNKIAIVTGGTRGVGRAIAERLLSEGAAVALCGRSQDSVDSAVAGMKPLGRVFGQAADVTQVEQVSRFFQAVEREFGGLDILVNNAGEGVFRKVGEMTPEEWRRNIDLNLNGAFYCSREALHQFARRGGGFIVNISSLAGKNGFSEAMMLDHRYDHVRVSSIMPGSVDTEFGGQAGKRAGDTSWMIAPEDVAEVVTLVLRMPARTMVSRVEMRPSEPRKQG